MPTRPHEPTDKLFATGLRLDRPFSTSDGHEAGLSERWLQRLVRDGLLSRPLRGVYLPVGAADTLAVRVACVQLVLPAGCVVTDRTAAWLHGAPAVLAPNDHLEVPRVSAYHRPHHRLRNECTQSGSRQLKDSDVVHLQGLPVTTPLRTACDLGRLLHRDSAMAALDALLGLKMFSHAALLDEVQRFRGFRGVRQLRAFAPLADPGSESFGESALRLRWYDAGLDARPETQIVVRRPLDGSEARLDLGSRKHRFAAEYDGEQFHGADRYEHDLQRRTWIRDELGWEVAVFRKKDVFGRNQDADVRLRAGLRRAMVRVQGASAS